LQHNHSVFGCIDRTFIASTLRPEETARKHLGVMTRGARKMTADLRELETDMTDSTTNHGKDLT
jgi:hypothetical protein